MKPSYDRNEMYASSGLDPDEAAASDMLNALFSILKPHPTDEQMTELERVLFSHSDEVNYDDYVPRFMKSFMIGVVTGENIKDCKACFNAFNRLRSSFDFDVVLHDGGIAVAHELASVALMSWAYPIKVKSEQAFSKDRMASMEYYQFALEVIEVSRRSIPVGLYSLYPLVFNDK